MLSCLIIDDEEIATRVVANYIGRIKGLTISGIYHNAPDAFAALQENPVDLLFLDVQMPEMSGFGLLKSLSRSPAVILTTAHPDFAIESYNFNAIDYLLKPFSFDRFLKAVDKAYNQLQLEKSAIIHPVAVVNDPKETPFIYIKSERQFIKILLEDVQYIESIKNHSKIYAGKNFYITSLNISEMEEKLPPQRFLRIHRSYIVALDSIEKFSLSDIIVSGQSLPIGNLYKDEVIKRLNQHIL